MEIRKINIVFLLLGIILTSCSQKQSSDKQLALPIDTVAYNRLKDIPMSKRNMKDFPFYVSPPDNYYYGGTVGEMNFDEIYHFYTDSSTLSIGGKYYESPILKKPIKQIRARKNDVYEDSLILSHFDLSIKQLGGVETNLPKAYSSPSVQSYDAVVDSVKRYLIRSTKGNIWIDLICLRQPHQINYSLIFEGRMSQPVNIIRAERLKYALENNGKVVIYVNFADGKTSLQPDGVKAVDEIAKLMLLDSDLRISIEAHTDDAGTAEYCRRLSYERVSTIASFLKAKGIKDYRYKKVAYGSSRMVADNKTKENRAKNTRIELVKTNIDETALRKAINQYGKAVLQITFESGKSIIKPEGLDIIDQIAKLLTTDKDLKLSIEGHTDNVGSALTNKKLSLDRANAVINQLEELGIDRKRLKSAGFGFEKPLVPNNNEENRRLNRRVEIVRIN